MLSPLFRFAQPGVLPSNRDVLVVAAIPYVGAIAVAEFQRLMFRNWDRKCGAKPGICLPRQRVWYAIQAGFPAEPEISVERNPQAGLEAAAQMTLHSPDWVLRLGAGARIVDVTRPKVGIGGEEPHSEVSIEIQLPQRWE